MVLSRVYLTFNNSEDSSMPCCFTVSSVGVIYWEPKVKHGLSSSVISEASLLG